MDEVVAERGIVVDCADEDGVDEDEGRAAILAAGMAETEAGPVDEDEEDDAEEVEVGADDEDETAVPILDALVEVTAAESIPGPEGAETAVGLAALCLGVVSLTAAEADDGAVTAVVGC